jgi:hypothetical protein
MRVAIRIRAATVADPLRLRLVRSWICGSRLCALLRAATADIRADLPLATAARVELRATVGPATAARAVRLVTAVAAGPVGVADTIQRQAAAVDITPAAAAADTLPAVVVAADTPPAAAVDILVVAAAIRVAAVIAKELGDGTSLRAAAT